MATGKLSSKRYGRIELTRDFIDSGEVPRMLNDLQATPIAMEYDYARIRFLMVVQSPQLAFILEGAIVPLCNVVLNQPNQTYEFEGEG